MILALIAICIIGYVVFKNSNGPEMSKGSAILGRILYIILGGSFLLGVYGATYGDKKLGIIGFFSFVGIIVILIICSVIFSAIKKDDFEEISTIGLLIGAKYVDCIECINDAKEIELIKVYKAYYQYKNNKNKNKICGSVENFTLSQIAYMKRMEKIEIYVKKEGAILLQDFRDNYDKNYDKKELKCLKIVKSSSEKDIYDLLRKLEPIVGLIVSIFVSAIILLVVLSFHNVVSIPILCLIYAVALFIIFKGLIIPVYHMFKNNYSISGEECYAIEFDCKETIMDGAMNCSVYYTYKGLNGKIKGKHEDVNKKNYDKIQKLSKLPLKVNKKNVYINYKKLERDD